MVGVYLYIEYGDVMNKIPATVLWGGAGGLAAAWLLTFSFFTMRVAEPKYRHTLWSTVSGRQCVQETFTRGESDEDKICIFPCNRLLWESDIGGDVQLWALENWAGWVRDAPAWFTPRIVATVPDEYIPKAQLAALGANRERRGSAASVRESLRFSVREEEEKKEEGGVALF